MRSAVVECIFYGGAVASSGWCVLEDVVTDGFLSVLSSHFILVGFFYFSMIIVVFFLFLMLKELMILSLFEEDCVCE